MLTVMKVMLDIVMVLGAAVIDTLVAPFITLYNVIAGITSLLSGTKIPQMDQYVLTNQDYNKMMSDAAGYWDTGSTSNNNNSTSNNYYAPVYNGSNGATASNTTTAYIGAYTR